MKATISNNTNSPKGFYIGFKQITVRPSESIDGDYEDALLQSLKDTGFDVEHEGKLKLGDAKPAKADTKAAKDEAEKIIADAKVEADKIIASANSIKDEAVKILADAKIDADKLIAEAEELTKADK